MGRHVGWIALHSGMAAGAHAILIPEQHTSMEQLCAWVTSAYDRGRARHLDLGFAHFEAWRDKALEEEEAERRILPCRPLESFDERLMPFQRGEPRHLANPEPVRIETRRDPTFPDTTCGALVSFDHMQKVMFAIL